MTTGPTLNIDDTYIIGGASTTPISYTINAFATWDDDAQTDYHLQQLSGTDYQYYWSNQVAVNYTSDVNLDLVHSADKLTLLLTIDALAAGY